MQLFIDSVRLEEIQELHSLGIISGVTTNPSLIANENVHFEQRIAQICAIVNAHVSAEVISTHLEGMMAEASKLIKLHPQVVVKLPLTEAGIQATSQLSKKKVQTNLTLCFSANQALLAARAGATFVSPFIGRLDDIAHDGLQLIRDIQTIYRNYSFRTQIIAASVRHPIHVLECAKLGVDIATCSYSLLKQLFHHPCTKIGLDKFLSDWQAASKI